MSKELLGNIEAGLKSDPARTHVGDRIAEAQMNRTLRTFIFESALWSALCLLSEAVCRFVLKMGFPYDSPATTPKYIFGDLRFWTAQFAFFHSRQFFQTDHTMMYPAPVIVAYKLFLLGPLATHPALATICFLCVLLVASWIALICLSRALVHRGLAVGLAAFFVLALYLTSFPYWFEFHQANMEFVVWVMVTLGIWAFWTEKPWVAAIFFGMAAAMKIFPFVFLGLFVARKQYRQSVFMIGVAGATLAASLWLVCPDVAYTWQQTNVGLARFREVYMLHLLPMESGFDHSLFCLFKRLLPRLPPPEPLGHLLTAYLVVCAVGGVALFFLRIRRLPIVNQVLCLSIAAILLPPTSYDYTLLHLYAPFALFIFVVISQGDAKGSLRCKRGLSFALSLFAFLMAAQSEWIYHGARFGGQLRAIALLLLWLVALVYPFDPGENRSPLPTS